MRLNVEALGGSPKDEECEDLAHLFCWSDTGYFFSLARQPGASEIEMVVADQLSARTRDLSAKLSNGCLLVRIPETVAAKLDGHAEYALSFECSAAQLEELHHALVAIFDGVGKYEKDF